MRRSVPIAFVTLALVPGCANGKSTDVPTTPTTGTPASVAPAADPPASSSAAASWTTFGGSASRAGVAPGAPAHPRLKRRFARTVDGQIYAQPLIAGGRIYVATENNTIYSFTTGGKLVWKRHIGTPTAGGDLPCGNIDPSGITGTPVIANGRIYAVAFLSSGHRHVLIGLRLSNGRVAVRANVDPQNRLVQQQRGALLAAHGRIYVPYGGLWGDCGPYRGVVISRTYAGRGLMSYRNPASEAGIWAPAGISSQAGTLLVSTGNGGAGSFGYQNSVIRLSPGLRRRGYWAPKDWKQLSAGDVDESPQAPLPVSGGRIFQIGKDGVGYLLKPSLGGVGGELQGTRVCGGGAFGADAFRAPMIVTPCGGSMYGLRQSGNSFSRSWQTGIDGKVAVIAGDSVFTITSGGQLAQLRMSNGSQVASTSVGGSASSFPAPSAAGNLLVAPAGRGFVAFGL